MWKPVFIMFIILNAKYHKYFTFYHTKLYSMSYFFLNQKKKQLNIYKYKEFRNFLSFILWDILYFVTEPWKSANE